MSLVSVTFQSNFSPYNAGEVAGFPEGQAKDLVSRGIAEYTNKTEDAGEVAGIPLSKKKKTNTPKGEEPPSPDTVENNLGDYNENTPKGEE